MATDPVQAVAEALIAHTRLSDDGRCSCGHVVPLGHSFAAHQAEAVVAAARPAIEREHREEWAAHIETWISAKGAPEFTAEAIVTALRQPRPPFGKVANPC